MINHRPDALRLDVSEWVKIAILAFAHLGFAIASIVGIYMRIDHRLVNVEMRQQVREKTFDSIEKSLRSINEELKQMHRPKR